MVKNHAVSVEVSKITGQNEDDQIDRITNKKLIVKIHAVVNANFMLAEDSEPRYFFGELVHCSLLAENC